MGLSSILKPPGGDAAQGCFLGVRRSARAFAWRERLAPGLQGVAAAIAQRHGLPEMLGRVLAARQVGIDDAPGHLDPTIKALMPDPSLLKDMDKAASRLAGAVQKREAVAIFGDYDVDGAASSALMSRFLAHHGLPARIYIPDRIAEGYGPNAAAMEGLVRDGAQLIVTVDCGAVSHEPLAAAVALGAGVVVIDHHQCGETLPEVDAVVNPNRLDDLSGQGHLCAAGVVFLVLVATQRELRARGHYANGLTEPPLLDWLDLVALATVCDVVSLTGLNRAYVVKGLQAMGRRRNLGLTALSGAAGLNQPPNCYHLGFILGPRINAGGRIGDAGLGARLLCLEDDIEAASIAARLHALNAERQSIERELLEEAVAQAERMIEEAPESPILVLASDGWHKGVVGLAASRLTERFRRPSCVISWAEDGELGTGSLRSVAGVDIGGAVRGAMEAGHLVKGGGHAMAAGLTVRRDRLDALKAFLADALAGSAAAASAELDIDGALTPASASVALIDMLERAGPYGQGNPQPRFAFPACHVRNAKVMGGSHVRCVIEGTDGSRLDAIAFRAAGQPLGRMLMEAAGMPLHVAGSLRRDSWNGRERIELTIEDAANPRRAGEANRH